MDLIRSRPLLLQAQHLNHPDPSTHSVGTLSAIHLHNFPFSFVQRGAILISIAIISHYSLRGLISLFPFCRRSARFPSSIPLYCISTGTQEGKGDSPIFHRVVATVIDLFPIISSRVEVLIILLYCFLAAENGIFQVLFCSGFYPSSEQMFISKLFSFLFCLLSSPPVPSKQKHA